MTVQLIAIDPGAISGAVAVFPEGGSPSVTDLPVVDGQVDAAQLARWLRGIDPKAAVVERVASMPRQGVSSTFKFGVAVGIIHGVLGSIGVPIHLVTPTQWKKGLSLIGTDKETARALAIRLYPGVVGLERKKDHGRADALLLGHWFMHRRKE
jgi:crossover junction endodeoxyribonuclease RuvC